MFQQKLIQSKLQPKIFNKIKRVIVTGKEIIIYKCSKNFEEYLISRIYFHDFTCLNMNYYIMDKKYYAYCALIIQNRTHKVCINYQNF